MSLEQEANAINAALQEPPPEMEEAPVTVVDLTIGIDIDGEWCTSAEVRELTGEDEEHLASFEKKKDLLYAEYMTEVLKLAVVSIGQHSLKDGTATINRLPLADRDTLYLGVVKATYGDTRELRINCPHCDVSNDILLELDEDFPIKRPDFDAKSGLEVKGKKSTYRLRLPNGFDMIELQGKSETPAEFNTRVLANCAIFEEGKEPKDRLVWAKKLSLADRKTLIDALLSTELGPDLREVDAHCAACEKQIPLVLDWVSLLFS